ncbi:hypothetical protein NW768_000747 [Fusarium equiseti]|uniref:Transcription factor n=1 Tax=Fusarium equiseti TaxID=61235 RepID=A0ABQ8RTS1_FUSEQ|nr:hypothetical protein NW768_000747 [Fusarium equiseti]
MAQHDDHMMRLNSLPLQERAEKETKKLIIDQRKADKKENGVIPTPPTTQVPQPPRTLLISPTSTTPPAALQIIEEHPSESDSVSESDSENEDEDRGTGTVDPWTAYQARWNETVENRLKQRTPLEYQVLWPVTLGHLKDVDHLQVGELFNQVTKGMNSLRTGKMLYYELDRWERCGLKKRFGRTVYKMHKHQTKSIFSIVCDGTADFWRQRK